METGSLMNEQIIKTTEPFITEHDTYLFKEGSHFKLYEKLGAHLRVVDGQPGVHFAVWAPNAQKVSVVGNFNKWQRNANPLNVRHDSSGIWEGFIPGLAKGELYKYFIASDGGYQVEKQDPFASYNEVAPHTSSVVWDLDYEWQDAQWMKERSRKNSWEAPISIYEMHIGSWRRVPEEKNRALTYRELAVQLPEYLKEMGYTHVEFMPVMEYPFYGSWGYQTLGYFSTTSRFGTPQDFMYLMDCLHQNGIGVILDWVPSHFPTDEHGLVYFDGTHLFEHADPRKGYHPDWKSAIFNYGRNEVREFLISSAMFWMDKFHADGLRVDGVASMLYLDYSRGNDWIPNEYGGRENIEAIYFLRKLNEAVYAKFPDVQMIAEESTAWGGVSRPTSVGGLGFGMKWNMGWMHDTLRYFSKEPIYRRFHQNDLTFGMLYQYAENFVSVFSHDEVVHGKASMLFKMGAWHIPEKAANLRALYAHMWVYPGKKLLFMGGEFAQAHEWRHDASLDWHLLQYQDHEGVRLLVRDLNRLYASEPVLSANDFNPHGFRWINCNQPDSNLVAFLRSDPFEQTLFLAVGHFAGTARVHRIGVPRRGWWSEAINTNSEYYGGSGLGNDGGRSTEDVPADGYSQSLLVTLPPLSALVFKWMA